jgi:hypothetical protein
MQYRHEHSLIHAPRRIHVTSCAHCRFAVDGIREGQLQFRSVDHPTRFLWQHIDGQLFYYYPDGPDSPAAQIPTHRMHRLPPTTKGWVGCTASAQNTIGGITLGSGANSSKFDSAITYHLPALKRFREIAEGDVFLFYRTTGGHSRSVLCASCSARCRSLSGSFAQNFVSHCRVAGGCLWAHLVQESFLTRKSQT